MTTTTGPTGGRENADNFAGYVDKNDDDSPIGRRGGAVAPKRRHGRRMEKKEEEEDDDEGMASGDDDVTKLEYFGTYLWYLPTNPT